MVMFQIINVTKDIQLTKSKEQNELLSLINATVSHEMRNPLNSIISQNIEKEGLYKKLKTQLDSIIPMVKIASHLGR